MDEHLASKHEIGSSRVCPTCNHNFSTKRAMKQHIRGQHKGDFKHKCDIEGCKFKGTDSKDVYNVHKVNAPKRKAKKHSHVQNARKYSLVKEIYKSTQRENYSKHQRTLNMTYVTYPTKQRHTSPTMSECQAEGVE